MTNRFAFAMVGVAGALSILAAVYFTVLKAPETTPVSLSTTPASNALSTPTVPGSWIPDTKGPWDGAIYQATSADGLTFAGKTRVLESAGVPSLLRLPSGELILTYQYFSAESESMFDVIAYSTSTDDGATWSETKGITFSGLPAPAAAKLMPMDPALVRAEDGSLRLYFTYHAKGSKWPEMYSAVAADGNIGSTFVVNTTPALSVSGQSLLDPAVVYFNGAWQHYTWKNGDDDNYHSTSTDGIAFTLQDDINLPMDFLGQVIPSGSGLRFYGTGKGGVLSAYSADGNTWTMDAGIRSQGADPGVEQLSNGTYIMIYTAANFNE